MKKQSITPAVQHAILRYCDTNKLSYDALGKELGVSSTTICLWISGKTQFIRPQHWVCIYPKIKRYLTGATGIVGYDGPVVREDFEEKANALVDAYRLGLVKRIYSSEELTREQKGIFLEMLEF